MQWGLTRDIAMDAAEYRRKAWQCLAQTHLMATQEARTRIVALAAAWLRLADWAERNERQYAECQQMAGQKQAT